jgi:hypothetical protein
MSTYKERIRLAMGGGDISTDAMRGLARHIGISYQAVKKLVDPEGGSNTLSVENSARAARHLGVSSDWLATGEGQMTRAGATDAALLPGEIEGALRVLAEALKAADAETRAAVAPLFALLAQQPERLESVTSTLMRLIPERKLTARNLQDDQREGKTITALLPSLANKEQQGAKRNPVQSRGRT